MENDHAQVTPQPDPTDLQAKYDSLHHLVISVLLLLVVVTGTLWIFLMRQVRTTGADLAGYRLQTTNILAQLKPNEPAMDDLLKKFQDFGRTNPDFVPLLAKYGIQPSAAPAATPGNRATTAPPAPATKK